MSRSALFVSSSTYVDDQLTRLPSAARDAAELGRLFADPAIGFFAVTTLTDPRSQDMREALEDLFADAEPDDVVVLYLSGHGMKDQHGNLFFAAHDTRPDRLQSTAVSAQFMCSVLNSSRARGAVVFLDCCYGGAFARGMVARTGGDSDVGEAFASLGSGARARAVITASSAIEYAFEGGRLTSSEAEPSVFASAMRDGILGGGADRDGDGWVGLNELFDFVRTRIQQLGRSQTPHLWTFGASGDLHLTRSPRGPRISAGALPAEIRELLASPLPVVRLGVVADLEERATTNDLGQARAAVAALLRLAEDDSLRVRAAASAALAKAALQVEPAELTLSASGGLVRARLAGPPVARDAHPEPPPEGVTAAVVDDEVVVSARPGVSPGRIEVRMRWAGGTVPVAVVVEPQPAHAIVNPRRTAEDTPDELPSAKPTAPPRPGDGRSRPWFDRATKVRWGESWLAAAGVLWLLTLSVSIDFDYHSSAFEDAPDSVDTVLVGIGLATIATAAARFRGVGGRVTRGLAVLWTALNAALGSLSVINLLFADDLGPVHISGIIELICALAYAFVLVRRAVHSGAHSPAGPDAPAERR